MKMAMINARSRIASSLSHVSALMMGIALPKIVEEGRIDGTIVISFILMGASLVVRHIGATEGI